MEITVPLDKPDRRMALFGSGDEFLRLIRAAFDIRISARDGAIKLIGDPGAVGKAATVLEGMQRRLRKRDFLTAEDVSDCIAETAASEAANEEGRIAVYATHASVAPKTAGQKNYIDAVRSNDLVFCLGPAGTGKTYLAVAMAVSMLKNNEIKRIVLVRPAVEAGEKLGYLPGDLQAKVSPYLRPLFDAMNDMMSFEQTKRFIQNDIVEVIPLAYMRGRTLNNAAVILDEAQNSTVAQMLMFLTRLGHNSKMIVTGDISQIDLQSGQTSGLIDAVRRLRNVNGVAICVLEKADIVRHRLVQDIVEAYVEHQN